MTTRDKQNNITTLARRLRPFLLAQVAASPSSTSQQTNKIILIPGGTGSPTVYAKTEAGLAAAIAAASSGDYILCPPGTISLTSGITVPAGVTLGFADLSFSGFTGPAVTLGSNATLEYANVVQDGTGYAAATAVYVNAVKAQITRVSATAQNATTNIGIDVTGPSASDHGTIAEAFAYASGGTTAYGTRIQDDFYVNRLISEATGATNNVGIYFNITDLDSNDVFIEGAGYAISSGYGVEVASGKYGRMYLGHAVGGTTDVVVNSTATLQAHSLLYTSITLTGTLRAWTNETSQRTRVYNSGALTISNNVSTALTFNSERYDDHAFHSTSTNTSRLTAPSSGVYNIFGSAAWAANTTGIRQLSIRLDGTTTIAIDSKNPQAAGATFHNVSTEYQLSAGQYVELMAYQNSGGNLNINNAGNYSPEFAMHRIR